MPERADTDALAHRVLHDPLTDLPNRALFFDRLELALARLQRHSTSIAVLFIDLDDFKVVNDSLGHTAGDKLLVQLAGRLRQAIRPADTIARFGGDEFVVLCEDIADARDAMTVAQRIVDATAKPFDVEAREMYATASVGVALALDPEATPETLLRDADAAMYRAKERGNGRVELFDEALRARILERLELENGLRRALQRGELRVYYQPEISLTDGQRVTGFEALVRWDHPERGLLSPADFMQIAEDTGLIVEIGAWVLDEACRQVAEWRSLGTGLGVAVNVSARQLMDPEMVDTVKDALERHRLPADALCLEVTESSVMRDPEAVLSTLTLVRELGVKIALDDFGVGFSSLAQLKELLPLHALKVDRSFIRGLGDRRNSAIVAAVVMLATTLGVTAVAEGVETEEQVEQARALGCDLSQGYFFTAPAPAAQMSELLAALPQDA